MEVKFDPQQGKVESIEDRLYFKSPDWVLVENIFAGIGAMPIWAGFWYWRAGDFPPWTETLLIGTVVGGVLCTLRFGADEIAMVLRIVITQSLIAYKKAKLWYNEQELNAEIDYLIAECEKEKALNAQLRGELSATKRKINRYDAGSNFVPPTPPPSERATATNDSVDPWEGYVDPSEFEPQDTATSKSELFDVDTTAKTYKLDESVESSFDAANELIGHWERHGNLSKGSAHQLSGIGSKRWAKAKQLLLDSGAARIDPADGLVFVLGSQIEIDLSIDRYREKLFRQLHS